MHEERRKLFIPPLVALGVYIDQEDGQAARWAELATIASHCLCDQLIGGFSFHDDGQRESE